MNEKYIDNEVNAFPCPYEVARNSEMASTIRDEMAEVQSYLKRFLNFNSSPKIPFWSRKPRTDMRGLTVQLNSITR